jgi:ribose transport system ATP-binding protein
MARREGREGGVGEPRADEDADAEKASLVLEGGIAGAATGIARWKRRSASIARSAANAAGPILELCGIGAQLAGVVALRDVSLAVRAGESHALVGESSAGKATLTCQEPMLAPQPSVGESSFLGRLPLRRRGAVDWYRLAVDAVTVMDRPGFHVDPRVRLADLGIAQRQKVEIARALSRNARIVGLAEPGVARSPRRGGAPAPSPAPGRPARP